MKKAFLGICTVLLCVGLSAQVNTDYYNKFKEAKLMIASHDEESAIPLLETLWERDNTNANVAYHLGASYIKKERKVKKAMKLLEFAKEHYTPDYDRTSVKERGSSEYTYYYMIIAYSLMGKCDKTIATLNEFYKVFSYEDEWFLVEGQKWHRVCGTKKLKDAKEELLAENAEKEIPAEPPVDVEEEEEEERVYMPRFPSSSDVKKIPEKRYRDRLTPITDPAERGIKTKTIDYTTTHSLYGVQVGAFIDPKFTREFDQLKNVEVYMDQNGVFRYVVGRLIHPKHAEKLLEYVKEVGYTDAFIVDINGGRYQEEVVTLDNQPIKLDIRGKVDFRVQIGAFREEIPDELVRTYLKIDRIRENIQGDMTVLTVGSYNSLNIARKYCDQIKEMGLPDAFVVAYNYENKITLNEAEEYLQEKSVAREDDKKKKR